MFRVLITFLLLAFFGLSIQSTATHMFSVYASGPNLLLLLAIFIGLKNHKPSGAIGAFLIGLLGDFASAKYLGPSAAGTLVAYCLTVILSQRVYAEHPVTLAMVALLCSLARSVVYVLFLSMYVSSNIFSLETLKGVAFEAFLTAIVAPIVFKIIKWALGKPKHSNSMVYR